MSDDVRQAADIVCDLIDKWEHAIRMGGIYTAALMKKEVRAALASGEKDPEEARVHALLDREYKRAQMDFKRRMADIASDPLPRDLILKMPIHGRANSNAAPAENDAGRGE